MKPLTTLIFACLPYGAIAQDLPTPSNAKCAVLEVIMSDPRYVEAGTANYLSGYLDGILATGIDRNVFRRAYQQACLTSPQITVDTAVQFALETINAD